MPRKKKTPTARRLLRSELEILEILWRERGLTIIEVWRELPGKPGYTTVQTRLNRMADKGLVHRSPHRPARYEAAISPESATVHDLDLLIKKVNQGRIVPLVAHLVRDRHLTSAEVAEIKALIAEAEQRSKSHSPRVQS